MRKWWTIILILKLPVHIFQNVYVNIKRILGMAQRLCDAGHYASNTIRMQAGQLEREWKSLAAAVEDRSVVLNMSVNFYKKAEQVRSFFFIQNSFKILVAYKISWYKRHRIKSYQKLLRNCFLVTCISA